MWPSVDSGYALAAVALAALAYVVVSVTRFSTAQAETLEKISNVLDNHLSEVADILELVHVKLADLSDKIDELEGKLDASHTSRDKRQSEEPFI